MTGFRNSLLILALVAALASCGSSNEKDAAEIQTAEDTLFSTSEGFIDKAKALELVDLYVDYANSYPDDSLAVEYLFKGAEFCLNLGEGQRAITLYDRVIQEYPDFRKVPECLFLKGYVYENYLGDLDNAKAIYLEFIEKYPDNEFADDAEISIQNLGKSPEELIKQFEEQQAVSNPE
ncbi:MAG: tetratricopeptide repeat protein [Bacteroidales bacterium]|nr:tetratricopeptide repeat protein [Bacteroidales bacterium]MCK5338113.1 tetratricopeptide repeat protein [Bacteroidales bacterium]